MGHTNPGAGQATGIVITVQEETAIPTPNWLRRPDNKTGRFFLGPDLSLRGGRERSGLEGCLGSSGRPDLQRPSISAPKLANIFCNEKFLQRPCSGGAAVPGRPVSRARRPAPLKFSVYVGRALPADFFNLLALKSGVRFTGSCRVRPGHH